MNTHNINLFNLKDVFYVYTVWDKNKLKYRLLSQFFFVLTKWKSEPLINDPHTFQKLSFEYFLNIFL